MLTKNVSLVRCPGIRIEPIAMEVNRLKKYVFTIILVEPWLVLCCRSWIRVVKNAGIRLFLEHHWSLHAFNDLLSTITVVDIEVYDGNSFYFVPVPAHEVSCSNCYVVYIAKTICLFLIAHIVFKCLTEHPSMMPRWPYRAKSICIFTCHQLVACLNDSP